MKSRMIHQEGGQRTFVLVFDSGDEASSGLAEFAAAHHVSAAQITAIGAFSRAVLGYFDWTSKTYRKISVDDQVEVLSLIGDVAQKDGKPAVHAHVVVGRSDGSTRGGHLLEGYVRPTLEVILVESPAHLVKKHDAESGLALIAL